MAAGGGLHKENTLSSTLHLEIGKTSCEDKVRETVAFTQTCTLCLK